MAVPRTGCAHFPPGLVCEPAETQGPPAGPFAFARRPLARARTIAPRTQDARLKLNMSADVTLFARKRRAAVVQTTALVRMNGDNQAYVEIEPWTFERRSMEIRITRPSSKAVSNPATEWSSTGLSP
jgi:hypothetical protein